MKKVGVAAVIIGVVVIAAGVMAAITRPERQTPEHAADAFLRAIRAGHFEASFAPLRPNGVNAETEMREKHYRPLWFWWFAGSRQSGGELRLHYKVIRGWIPIPSPVWVLVKNGGGKWRVTGFEAWY
jgi:hypothetical protein